jgi:hypothetical protein
LRVVLVYGRSNCIPDCPTAPAEAKRAAKGGLALDCVYVHDKPVEGVNRPQVNFAA